MASFCQHAIPNMACIDRAGKAFSSGCGYRLSIDEWCKTETQLLLLLISLLLLLLIRANVLTRINLNIEFNTETNLRIKIFYTKRSSMKRKNGKNLGILYCSLSIKSNTIEDHIIIITRKREKYCFLDKGNSNFYKIDYINSYSEFLSQAL